MLAQVLNQPLHKGQKRQDNRGASNSYAYQNTAVLRNIAFPGREKMLMTPQMVLRERFIVADLGEEGGYMR